MNKLKYFALSKHIPIISDEALKIIKEVIKENNYQTMLELGTAIGYSSIMLSSDLNYIETIEKKELLFEEALRQIKLNNKEAIITVRLGDALKITPLKDNYDLIFIDAAKGQYINYFKKFKQYLNEGGVIITDNLHFHNLELESVSKQTKKLIKKIADYKEFLINNEEFETKFIDQGDGLSISKKEVTNEIINNNP